MQGNTVRGTVGIKKTNFPSSKGFVFISVLQIKVFMNQQTYYLKQSGQWWKSEAGNHSNTQIMIS